MSKEIELSVQEDLGIKDKSNPRSLINILPGNMAKALEVCPDDMFLLSEDELKRHSGATDLEMRLRIQFWNEYNTAQNAHRKMNMRNVVAGICTDSMFNKKVISNSYKVAFICTPLADYALMNQELLRMGYEQIKDIMLRPHTDQHGNLEPRSADVKFKIWQDVQNRTNGMVVHRIESKNLNVNVETQAKPAEDLTDIKEIKRQIEELEQATGRKPELLDVTPMDGIVSAGSQRVRQTSKKD